MDHMIPFFIGQAIVALIVIVTHIGLYFALQRMCALLDDTHARVKHLEKGL